MGTIYNSRYKSGPMITMHSRLTIPSSFKNSTPGPGSYQHFSQFGIWVPKNKTDGYNVRKRVKSAKNSDNNIRNYFKNKKNERANTENNYIDNKKRGRIISALR